MKASLVTLGIALLAPVLANANSLHDGPKKPNSTKVDNPLDIAEVMARFESDPDFTYEPWPEDGYQTVCLENILKQDPRATRSSSARQMSPAMANIAAHMEAYKHAVATESFLRAKQQKAGKGSMTAADLDLQYAAGLVSPYTGSTKRQPPYQPAYFGFLVNNGTNGFVSCYTPGPIAMLACNYWPQPPRLKNPNSNGTYHTINFANVTIGFDGAVAEVNGLLAAKGADPSKISLCWMGIFAHHAHPLQPAYLRPDSYYVVQHRLPTPARNTRHRQRIGTSSYGLLSFASTQACLGGDCTSITPSPWNELVSQSILWH